MKTAWSVCTAILAVGCSIGAVCYTYAFFFHGHAIQTGVEAILMTVIAQGCRRD